MIEYSLCPAWAHIRVITVGWERGASCCEPPVGIRGNITVTCIEYLLCGRYSGVFCMQPHCCYQEMRKQP